MPWKIVSNDSRCKGKPFAVVKKADNKLVGCHTTRESAGKQLAALNIAEKEHDMTDEVKDIEEIDAEKAVDTEVNGVPIDLIPYASYEAMEEAIEKQEKQVKELTSVITPMVDNVIADVKIDNDKGIQKVFSGFMQRLSSVMGKEKKQDKKENKEIVVEESNKNTFKVIKGKDGRMLWLASYSNNIRDEDHPPEIIASESHRGFVKMVDSGEMPMPELWLWHCPELVLGKATTVAYDEESGCAVAAGYFSKDAEPVAIAIQNSDVAWGVSHGMPAQHIKRSEKDPTIIIQHVTKEISPLPAWAAANKLAGFTILKEVNMAFTDEKRQQLIAEGFDGADLTALEESLKDTSDMADNLGMERKEEGDEETPEPTPEDETPEKEISEDEQAFTEDQTSQLKAAFETFGKQFAEQIGAMVDEKIAPVVDALAQKEKNMEEQFKHTLANTPAASQSAFLSDVIFGKQLQFFSATESDETKLDGRTKLAKDSPEETEATASDNGDPMAGAFLDIISGALPGQVQ